MDLFLYDKYLRQERVKKFNKNRTFRKEYRLLEQVFKNLLTNKY